MSSQEEYRPCVAAVIVGPLNSVLWCQRIDHDGWQFPQGGIDQGESPLEAVLRAVSYTHLTLPTTPYV